jgi:hypothetical protein
MTAIATGVLVAVTWFYARTTRGILTEAQTSRKLANMPLVVGDLVERGDRAGGIEAIATYNDVTITNVGLGPAVNVVVTIEVDTEVSSKEFERFEWRAGALGNGVMMNRPMAPTSFRLDRSGLAIVTIVAEYENVYRQSFLTRSTRRLCANGEWSPISEDT